MSQKIIRLMVGAGRGIGRATALAFAQTGADVALLSRTKSELDATAAECEKFGVKTLVVPADMTNEEQVNDAVKKVTLNKSN
jgi:short-subunit dehydrogenase